MQHPIEPVRLSASQHGLCRNGALYPIADSRSAATYCRNLRLNSNGRITPTLNPKILGFIEGNPIGFDRRPGHNTLFSQLDDGTICIEGEIDASGEFSKQYTELYNPRMSVSSMGSSGNLVVFSLTDGTLLYVHRSAQGYRWLGEMPQTPTATAEAITTANIAEAEIEAYKFPDSIADFRPGVPGKIATELGAKLLEAYNSALSSLHNTGLWHNPVALRFGYRLYDGSLLSLSAPIAVGLDRGIDYCPVMNLPLIPALDEHNNQIGYAGTNATRLQLHGYRIRVSCNEIPPAWRDIISGIEMYVCAEPEGVDSTNPPRVTQRQVVGTGNVINLRAARLDPSVTYRVFGNGAWYRHSVTTGGTFYVPFRNPASMQLLDMQEITEQSLAVGIKARLLLDHDDMLHMADISRYSPLPQPSGYPADPEGNATVEPLSLAEDNGVARFNIPETYIMESDDGIILHAPMLLWHSGDGVGQFRLRVLYGNSIYETCISGYTVEGEKAWMYLTDGSAGLNMYPISEEALQLPRSVGRDFPSMLITMQRGNPLVAVSHTTSIGGKIEGLTAQSIGGGAYTRQYIYLFNNLGITALTHNHNGIHTNCRTISPEYISDPQRLSVPSSHGVFAFSDTGKLLMLNDAKCNTLLSGMGRGWKGLGWDSLNDELWLCHSRESMVLQLGAESLCHIRDCEIDRFLQCGPSLYTLCAYRLACIGSGETVCDSYCWTGMPEPYTPGKKRILQVPMYGDNLDITITIEQVAEDTAGWETAESLQDTHRAFVIERVRVNGNLHRPLQIPLHPLSKGGNGRPSLMRVKVMSND